MARAGRDGDVRVRGFGLAARFVLTTSLVLSFVMLGAGYWIHQSTDRLAAEALEDTLANGVALTASAPEVQRDSHGRTSATHPGVVVASATRPDGTRLLRYMVTTPEGRTVEWLVPEPSGALADALAKVVGIILLLVVLVGAVVSMWTARQVVDPLRTLIDDVRQVARGNLAHRTRVRGGGEVGLLARALDRMASDLAEAREAELELSMRERELELAGGVREALMPLGTPLLPGFDLRSAHLTSGELLGDFFAFVEREDGCVGLLVCDVSGVGVPAALVGATARAYLTAELSRGGDVTEAFRRVNRALVRDVRRGMYVTALYVHLDPAEDHAEVLCAGHKVPLLLRTAADGKLRKVHPGGIALGFDRGPVFDRALDPVRVELAPGDLLVLCNQGTVAVRDEAGQELGEPAWYQAVARAAAGDPERILRNLRARIESYVGDGALPLDVSIITVAREA